MPARPSPAAASSLREERTRAQGPRTAVVRHRGSAVPPAGTARFPQGAGGRWQGSKPTTHVWRTAMPPARQPDQSAPTTVSPTGVTYEGPREGRDPRAQAGDFLTSGTGVRLPDTDHSLKAGRRGPVLLQDFHLREKINAFDHERIPERVVHARG